MKLLKVLSWIYIVFAIVMLLLPENIDELLMKWMLMIGGAIAILLIEQESFKKIGEEISREKLESIFNKQ